MFFGLDAWIQKRIETSDDFPVPVAILTVLTSFTRLRGSHSSVDAGPEIHRVQFIASARLQI